MKILLFGRNGQVGRELNRSLLPLGELIVLDRVQADFSQPRQVRDIVRQVCPDIIVNAVAYTAVDKAEAEEALAHTINAETPSVLAEEAGRLKALLVHYSTDYVFDGAKDSPYVETDAPCPINAYGRTKLAGEQAIIQSGCDHLIFRTSWVYAARGHNFMLTMLKLAAERENLNIVDDQIGAPTSARLIADTSSLCIQQAVKERHVDVFSPGLYHLTASGSTSWYGFTGKIIETARQQGRALKLRNLNPIPTSDYPTPAKRPLNSRLSLKKLESSFGMQMPNWQTALQRVLEDVSAGGI